MKTRGKSFVAISFVALLFTSLFTIPSEPARAVTAADWRAGNIINDTLFADGRGMSVAQIQSFLNARLPFCDVHGSKTSELGGGTRAQYGASVGNPAPFTCITNYYEVPKTTPGAYIPENNYGRYNSNGTPYIPPGAKSAAQLIYDASQQYSINPKALLIKLATESAGPLTSDEWPLKKQYYYAMGAHCPDSGPGGSANCNVNYAGFSIQIAEAAKLLRGYLDGMSQSWWPYKKPFQNNHVLWHVVERGCGGANVYIETKATAALYTYTPYQPNAAALRNMYGTGDHCSTYGNRNFWRVWNDWFGSTQDSGYTPFFQFPGSVQTYILGANKTYYTISNYEKLKDYGFETSFGKRVRQLERTALSGHTHKGELPYIARFEGIGVYLLQDGKTKPFPSEEIFANYGYTFGQEATLPKEMNDILPQGAPMWRVAKELDGKTTYYISSGEKQAICNTEAFTKLGSPVYSSQPSTALRVHYLASMPNAGPIAMDGDIIESWGDSKYGVWQNNALTPINADVARKTNAITCGVVSDAYKKLPLADKAIDNLVSSNEGQQFVIDRSNKLIVNREDTATLAAPPQSYIPLTNSLLNKLGTQKLQTLVRVDNSAPVYVIRDGKSYGIPSEQDLYGLGYNFNQVQNITRKTFSATQYSGLIYRPGKLVREDGTLGVYILDATFKKHPFTSEQEFFNYRYSWSQVDIIPKGSLSAYASDAAASIYIREDDGNYWLMDNGVKRRVNGDLPSTQHYSLLSRNIPILPASVLSRFPMSSAMSKVFRASNDRGVYMIDNGKKRVFASEAALFSRGFTWNDVRIVSPHVVRSIPAGDPIFN